MTKKIYPVKVKQRLQEELVFSALDVVVAAVAGHAPNVVRACVRCAKLELAIKALDRIEKDSGALDDAPERLADVPNVSLDWDQPSTLDRSNLAAIRVLLLGKQGGGEPGQE